MKDLETRLELHDAFWRIDAGSSSRNILFYRIEDGDNALRAVAEEAVGVKNIDFDRANANMAAEKEYADLYREVLSRIELNKLRTLRTPIVDRVSRVFYGDL